MALWPSEDFSCDKETASGQWAHRGHRLALPPGPRSPMRQARCGQAGETRCPWRVLCAPGRKSRPGVNTGRREAAGAGTQAQPGSEPGRAGCEDSQELRPENDTLRYAASRLPLWRVGYEAVSRFCIDLTRSVAARVGSALGLHHFPPPAWSPHGHSPKHVTSQR